MSEQKCNDSQVHIQQESESRNTLEDELIALKEESQELLDQYEEVINRSNSLQVEVEIAHLEFNQVFDAIDDAIWVIDNKNTVLRINNTFVALLKLKNKTAAIGKKCYDMITSDLCHTEKCPLKHIRKRDPRIEMDIELEITRGKRVPFWLTATPLFGLTNEILGIVEQYKDITERKHYEEALEKANLELKRLATVDGLTQLANRRLFDETLQEEWLRMKRKQQPLSVILCDVDFFKRYNDYYGHQEGDECLKAVAKCMKSCIHRPADLAARYGGEEFIFILPDTTSKGAHQLAETIRTAIVSMKREHIRSEVNDFVTLSFGVATVVPPIEGGNAEALVKTADDALYASKGAGRNLVTTRDLG